MAVTEVVRQRTRANPRAVTLVVSVVGYVLVGAGFAGALPFPSLSKEEVELFALAIAVINTTALTALLAGWRLIKRGDVRKHRAAMLSAFALIILFLVLYLWKVSGGYTKEFFVPADAPLASVAEVIETAYLLMLAVHIILSAVSVPVVIHAVVLGLTHTPAELRQSIHPRVGRIAVAVWSVSLALGVITYILLQIYDSRPLNPENVSALVFIAAPALDRD